MTMQMSNCFVCERVCISNILAEFSQMILLTSFTSCGCHRSRPTAIIIVVVVIVQLDLIVCLI